ncbi:MAG: DUF2306 domain-containing protein [Planctomycetales bacterium]|nr:DUF2306 domain-containing protein [Planctomycetales bacterium]
MLSDLRSSNLRDLTATALWIGAYVVVVKVTSSIVLVYSDYFPPNFQADFLIGRETHFWGPYAFAFYIHIVSGPVAIVLGLLLINSHLRIRFASLHRRIGQMQILLVSMLVAPSGLIMSAFAFSHVARIGFAMLAVFTGLTAILAWKNARSCKFDRHQMWALRCFVLLCSAIALRLIGGVSSLLEVDTYAFAAWGSWLVPITILEVLRRRKYPQSRSTS